MPSAVSPNPRAASNEPDELDRMLDYDNVVEEFLNDIPARGSNAEVVPNLPQDEDQEVQVKRQRKPIPKLDETRLLSEAGLPRLRRITKKRLKFRGKHHEFSDIGMLLSTYQLWLDDLYPRAKFRDALTIIEKLGHSKRMQVMRKGWLDSTKPNRVSESATTDAITSQEQSREDAVLPTSPGGEGDVSSPHNTGDRLTPTGRAPREDEVSASLSRNAISHAQNEEPDDDEMDELLAGDKANVSNRAAIAKKSMPFEVDDDDDDEDELDALLAEQKSGDNGQLRESGKMLPDMSNEFADEEEAMAEMGMW